jgi:hypothetical protein
VALALILTVAPLAVSALHTTLSHGSGYHPTGDMALTELLTRDVGTGNSPLIGPFSRDGWHHPGPTAFYVFALPYRLLGSTSTAMNVAALVVNGLSVAAMAWLARRRGGTPLVLVTLVGCALVMRTLGPDQLRLPWNPFVTVMPYGVLLFLTWSLLCRDRWALPAAVVVTTYLAQAHIGYVALALPLLAFGTVWLLVGTLADRRRSAGSARGATPAGPAWLHRCWQPWPRRWSCGLRRWSSS